MTSLPDGAPAVRRTPPGRGLRRFPDPISSYRPMALRPMLATLADAPLVQRDLVYEPKYDGIRAIIEIAPGKGTGGRGASTGAHVRIWSRNGNEKTHQFPTIRRALEAVGAKLKGALVLDGEIVALDKRGRPAGFQRLRGRIHPPRRATSGVSIAAGCIHRFDILPREARSHPAG